MLAHVPSDLEAMSIFCNNWDLVGLLKVGEASIVTLWECAGLSFWIWILGARACGRLVGFVLTYVILFLPTDCETSQGRWTIGYVRGLHKICSTWVRPKPHMQPCSLLWLRMKYSPPAAHVPYYALGLRKGHEISLITTTAAVWRLPQASENLYVRVNLLWWCRYVFDSWNHFRWRRTISDWPPSEIHHYCNKVILLSYVHRQQQLLSR